MADAGAVEFASDRAEEESRHWCLARTDWMAYSILMVVLARSERENLPQS